MATTIAERATIDKLTTGTDVYRVLDFVRSTTETDESQWVELDFSRLCESPAQRINTSWTEILSNELLGELAAAKLEIHPPNSHRGLKTFDRCGLSFAISQRDQSLTRVVDSEEYPGWPAPDWGATWSPYDARFRNRLFSTPFEPTELLNREFAMFINPHMYASDDDLTDELSDNQAYAWIRQLIQPKSNLPSTKNDPVSDYLASDRLILDLHEICYQLVSNLRYAFEPLPDPLHNIPRGRCRSYVLFYSTRGGGNSSFNRLHIVIADYGHGIIRTIIPKLGISPGDSYEDPCNIIEALLSRQIQFSGYAPGDGYDRIVKLIHKHKGRISLTTGYSSTSEPSHVIRASLKHDQPLPTVVRDDRLCIFGTIVHVTIPLPTTFALSQHSTV